MRPASDHGKTVDATMSSTDVIAADSEVFKSKKVGQFDTSAVFILSRPVYCSAHQLVRAYQAQPAHVDRPLEDRVEGAHHILPKGGVPVSVLLQGCNNLGISLETLTAGHLGYNWQLGSHSLTGEVQRQGMSAARTWSFSGGLRGGRDRRSSAW